MTSFKFEEVADIIASAGGEVVGRTRLQKIAYLLTVTGLDSNFLFSYKHYGPYSEQLASVARLGAMLGTFSETQQTAAWGGTYSTYILKVPRPVDQGSDRAQVAAIAAKADAVELELAATAVYLANEGFADPWAETTRRKPEKSTQQRIAGAKSLLEKLGKVQLPNPLPNLS